MYQLSQPPRVFLQINDTNGSTNIRNASFAKKSTVWSSKKSTKSSVPTSPTPSECESDDSGLSSAASIPTQNKNYHNKIQTIINDDQPKKPSDRTHQNGLHYQLHLGTVNVNNNTNQRYTAVHQQSLLFHNKRRYPTNRTALVTGRASSVHARCQLAHLHQLNMSYSIAPDRFLMKAHLIHVKNSPTNLITGSKWDNLSRDMWSKFILSQQTEDIFKKKMELWRFLYLSIKSVFPRYSLYLVGSTVTGFGSQNSDMDLCLLVKHPETGDSRSHALDHLTTIYHFIQSKEMLYHAELIRAKVPILKFCDNRFFLEVDLNCNNVVGIRNTHLLYCYSQLDWRVRPLILIVKLWAQFNNINDAKNKTISSYSLVLMVIHFLQCGINSPVLPCLQKEFPEKFSASLSIYNIDLLEEMPKYISKNDQSLGELFYGFLQYYTDFEYSKYAISVRTGSLLDIDECRASHHNELYQWKLLCVEEPFDLSNTARSVYDPDVFQHIQGVFERSKRELEKTLKLSTILPDKVP